VVVPGREDRLKHSARMQRNGVARKDGPIRKLAGNSRSTLFPPLSHARSTPSRPASRPMLLRYNITIRSAREPLSRYRVSTYAGKNEWEDASMRPAFAAIAVLAFLGLVHETYGAEVDLEVILTADGFP